MSEDKPPPSSDVEFEVETNPTDGKLIVKGKIPASLPAGLGRGLARACEFAFAGIAPNIYRQASDRILRSRVQRALADKICENIDDPQSRELASSLLHQGLFEQANRIERRSEILDLAAPELRSIAEGPPLPISDIDISDEFLFHFWQTADRVSVREVREIFSKILAGEIASPGGFSAATLNLLTTLHPDLARKFETFCNMTIRYDDSCFVITDVPPAENPATTPNSISSSRKYGEPLIDFSLTRDDIYDLHSVGLIRSTGGREYPDFTNFYSASNTTLAGRPVRFVVGTNAQKEEGWSITEAVAVISLTQIGSELRSVIALQPNIDYANKLKEVMQYANVEMTFV